MAPRHLKSETTPWGHLGGFVQIFHVQGHATEVHGWLSGRAVFHKGSIRLSESGSLDWASNIMVSFWYSCGSVRPGSCWESFRQADTKDGTIQKFCRLLKWQLGSALPAWLFKLSNSTPWDPETTSLQHQMSLTSTQHRP